VADFRSFLQESTQNVDRLADPQNLRSAAERISQVAVEQGATYLLAASPEAERLVGAALLCSPNLRAVVQKLLVGQENDAVMIVDVNLASGTSIARAARRARRSGAVQVVGTVLHMADGAVGASECQVDRLTVIGGDP
jgi:phosphoribosylpyrophosphate synthetase